MMKKLPQMTVQRDQLWKIAFRFMMPRFVEFFFPNKYDEVDWDKEILFLDKELHTIQTASRPKNRVADVLVMLHLKNGKPMYLFLHIEIQGYFDEFFAFRVHQMCYRIEDLLGSSPVMLSIFTDDDLNFHPKEYKSEIWGTSQRTIFNTYKVMKQHPRKYRNTGNPVALIMEAVYYSTQIKKTTDQKVMKLFLPIVRKLLTSGYSKKEVQLVMSFIEAHVKFGNSENYRIFEQKIDKMVQYETTEDILSFFDTEKRMLQLKEAEERTRKSAEQAKQAEKQARQSEEQARQSEEQALVGKEQERSRTERSVLWMINEGLNKIDIANFLDISLDEITAIEEKYKDNNPVTDFFKGQLNK